MAEHDYDLANDTGANFRSDLNLALDAIVSNNSKATAPTTTFAFMFWADTTADILKQRNAADSAWIDILTLSTGVPVNARVIFNTQTGTTYTLVLADAAPQTVVTMNNVAANTLTVPPNSSVAFAVGTEIHVSMYGAGVTTIAPGAAVTINTPSTLVLSGQWATVTLIKTATDTWLLMGSTT